MVIRVDIDRLGRLHYIDTKTHKFRSKVDYQEQYKKPPRVRKPPKLKPPPRLKPPKIVKPPEVWRLTVAINNAKVGIPIAKKYYSYRIQVWGSREDLEAMEDDLKQECIDGLERTKLLKRCYKRDEWWFAERDEDVPPNVGYDPAGKWHERDEGLEKHL